MPRVVLVTGASRYIGSRLAAQLSADPQIERIVGVDVVPPAPADLALLDRTEFVRADIRNPLIARVIAQADVDTVVHASLAATPRAAGGRGPMKEMNVLGTMQLLAACQKSESVRRLVLKSTTSVYGSSPRDPAVFTEGMRAKAMPQSGYAKDAVEVEGYVRGFARRRPDIGVTVLRFANFIGPSIDTPLTRYLSLPVVPMTLGFDPRLQFVHESDAIEVLRLAAARDHPGVFNVAGDGTLLLSQAIRRAGRVPVPVPGPMVTLVGQMIRRTGLVDYSLDQLKFINFGRVVDSTLLRTEFGYHVKYTTADAYDSFLHERPVPAFVSRDALRSAESWLNLRFGSAASAAEAVLHRD